MTRKIKLEKQRSKRKHNKILKNQESYSDLKDSLHKLVRQGKY